MKDDLGNRIKSFYENRSKIFLLRRTPVIIRVDGKSFSNFCKRFEKPYDEFLNGCLNNTLRYLCNKVQCVKMGQRHSDEMSLLLIDYENIDTEPYFEYNVQKICSVVASMTSTEFCRQLILSAEKNISNSWVGNTLEQISEKQKLSVDEDWPTFDCRCFNIPENEISNYYWWRLLDCKRSSINMTAQSLFSHSQIQNKTCNEMQEMMFQEKGINWDTLPQERKSGFICLKKYVDKIIEKGPGAGKICSRSVWDLKPAPKQKIELNKIVEQIIGFYKFVGCECEE